MKEDKKSARACRSDDLYLSIPVIIGSLSAGFLAFLITLTFLLRVFPAGKPFLGHACLPRRGAFVGILTKEQAAPAIVRAIFVISYLAFAATAAATYTWQETSLFGTTAPGCGDASCLASADFGPNIDL